MFRGTYALTKLSGMAAIGRLIEQVPEVHLSFRGSHHKAMHQEHQSDMFAVANSHITRVVGDSRFEMGSCLKLKCMQYLTSAIFSLATNAPSLHNQVTTVDKYQGQQNDYVLLSLVRTRAVGHLRDVRRLVVALSRARLGLYVFGRAQLFANCYEMAPAMTQLLARPTQFAVHPHEQWQVCAWHNAVLGWPTAAVEP